MNSNDYEIIDNFLEKKDFENIKDIMMSDYFPWYYLEGAVIEEYNKKNQFQFSHLFYIDGLPKSNFFNILSPSLLKLKAIALMRIKANLNPRSDFLFEHGFHTDYPDSILNQRTAVFYLNTNNGHTLFEDGTKIESLENRLVSFKTSVPHTGSTCTDKNRRVVINFNYIV
jgi:hypothetical protein